MGGTKLVGLGLVVIATGCLKSAEKLKFSAIPEVVVRCETAHHPDCSAPRAGKPLYVALTANEVDCTSYLANQKPQENLNNLFDAVGSSTVAHQGTFLTGRVNSWTNFGRVRIYDLPSRVYAVCAFIDLNNDGRWQPTEPIGQGEAEAGGKESVIEDWS